MKMIIDVSRYSPIPSDKFIFDANIWISIYCPIADHNKVSAAKYSDFYKKLLVGKNPIFISSHIISEFINRYLRIDFDLIRLEDASIKEYKRDYRAATYYTATMAQISADVQNKILKTTKKLHGSLTLDQISQIMNQLPAPDFNDAVLIEKVRDKDKDIKIVTDDGDFGRYKNDFDILTSNRRLLES